MSGTELKPAQPTLTLGSSATSSKSPTPTETTETTTEVSSIEASSGHQLPGPTSGQKSTIGQERISKKMLKHSEICWEGCPTNHGKSPKSCRRIPCCIPTLIIIFYSLLKISLGLTVPDLDPELMNAQNFDFAKPKLFFKNIGR
jgi:hypothetical protein